MLYSYQSQEPKPLPFRITLSNGLTRTDPTTFTDQEIANAGYLSAPNKPIAEDNQVVSWDSENFQWVVRDLTAEEVANQLAARRAGMIVTPRQARLALLQAGYLESIDTAIAGLSDLLRDQVTIEWEYAVQIERMSPWVVAMTESLGMTPEQVDQLFEAAAQI